MAGICFSLVVLSRVEHWTAQTLAYGHFRNELAEGTAPVGPVDSRGRLLRLGSPIALLRIPSLGLHQVVLQGTSAGTLTVGPGHLRDTVMPGEEGTSVIFGRAAAYGGPFRSLAHLHPGAEITVTTGVGTSTYKVIDQRRAGDPEPPSLEAGGARLTLVTATGAPFVPDGVLEVDADLQGRAQQAPSGTPVSVAPSELAMAIDTRTLWELVLLLQLLIVVAIGAVVSWRKWGRAQTWVVFFPIMSLVCYWIMGQVVHLLPNLM